MTLSLTPRQSELLGDDTFSLAPVRVGDVSVFYFAGGYWWRFYRVVPVLRP